MAPSRLVIDTSMDAPPGRATKLFLGGITKSTTTKQLREHFQRYGRVLDCIAMRQPDGKSRGFGYVTLDSPAAASKCLDESQVIDNRVIDVKLAVPEASSVASASTATPMSAFTPASAYGDVWGGSPWQTPYLNDVMPPWACAGPSFESFEMFSDYRHAPQIAETPPQIFSTQAPSAFASPAPRMSTEPLSVRSTLFENDQPPPSANSRLVENDPALANRQATSTEPRCPLGDITNISPKVATNRGWVPSFHEAAAWPAPSLVVYEEDNEASVATEGVAESLPSVGSAMHAAGECQRCDLFARGRCSEGRSCSLCHIEHPTSRRERRERRVARQSAQRAEEQTQESEDAAGASVLLRDSSGACEDVEEARLVAAPPGLTPIKRPAERLSMSAASTAASSSTPSSVPATISELAPRTLLATSPLSSTASQFHRSPPLQFLSTTPSPMRSPPSVATSGWQLSASPLSSVAELERTWRPMMTSFGTQTDEDEHLCPACGRDEVSRCLPELR